MDLNDKMIEEIASQLGLKGNAGISSHVLRQLETKSDSELEREILKIKEQLKANNISHQKQIAILNNLAPMMNPKQKARLQKIIELLKK